ncbi:PTS lactose/cellobiose transporter subunit IIA [Mesoplasma florum]|uniref:PTS lactose/cellobiose transporter subunit IIA n=1 Tax=Mesoplasma florum TaxID=2151 RepID=UPI000D03C4E6|nr:PTS lactose/cellobiose transporter subunit IIA [Mesoplasma florum]AVN58920.1 PTS lactose/cellobiose transporter subunit IIA [Mesoplasma florum]AVN63679.1 PTS lactose/cellobiose transporter subunit IIA [Mesoplasma florum]
MENNTLNVSIELIGVAGTAKSLALQAIKEAQKGDYQQSIKTLEDARTELTKVHKVHAELIGKEASGEKLDLSLLFIHSQDHLTSAIVILDLAEHIINLYTK